MNPLALVCRVFMCLVGVIWIAAGAAEKPREKFVAAFAPFDGGPVSVSPNGLHIACVRREKGEAAVFIAAINGTDTAFR